MIDALGGISAQAVAPRPKAESVDVQSLLRSALAKTGGDATVTVQYGYSVGADGSLQVSSATVSTVEKHSAVCAWVNYPATQPHL